MTKHPRTRVAIPVALACAAVLDWGAAAQAYFAGGGKDAEKGNDCLIGYQVDASDVTQDGKKNVVTCTDCDASCDLDGVDEPNGSCTFEIGVCINQSGVEGCTPPAALDKAKAKVKGASVDIDVSQLLEGSACSALLDLPVELKKNGKKQGSAKFSLSAQVKKNKDEGIDKTRKDKDKLTYICLPLAEGESCGTTTTTTTTTPCPTVTTSTIPVKPCGNGVIDGGEACDPAAVPTGCAGGETCIIDCTCATGCAAPSGGDPTGVTFTTGIGTTQCGSPGFTPLPAAAPFGGTLQDGSSALLQNLGLGCLYIGGGNSTVPGGATPDSAPSTFAVDLVCNGGDTLVLGGAATGGLDCTVEDGPTKYCANGHPGTDGNGACASDTDCRPLCVDGSCVNGAPEPAGGCVSNNQCGSGSVGCVDLTPDNGCDECAGIDGLVCVPTANCYFGPPLPVKNDVLSTCVQNVFDGDAFGIADVSAGSMTVGFTLSSRVHFTSTNYPNGPCPTCVAGFCDAGPNQGQACTGVGVDGTTHDCPPDAYFFLAPLSVTLDPLTTNASTLPSDGTPSSDGLFCPFQSTAGAFKVSAGRLVTMQGEPAAGGLSTTPADATIVSAFCIPKTGSVVIDAAANLPGPGATSLGGTLQLQVP